MRDCASEENCARHLFPHVMKEDGLFHIARNLVRLALIDSREENLNLQNEPHFPVTTQSAMKVIDWMNLRLITSEEMKHFVQSYISC
jgi:hypothetical protein